MFTTIVDVAIGIVFIYLLLSLMCSAANEIIELLLKKRAIDLERGIREMLAPGTGSGTNDIVQKLYDHALINNLFGKRYQDSKIASWRRYIWRTQLPSYIPARSFALALMDLVATSARDAGVVPPSDSPPAEPPASGATGSTSTPASNIEVTLSHLPSLIPPGDANNPLTLLRQAIATTPLLDPPESLASPIESPIASPIETSMPDVRQGLIALIDAAGDDVVKARENIETWFNNSMDRVSSWYKRRTQVVIMILGLVIAVATNADSITIANKLSTDETLRNSLVAAAQEYSKAHATSTPAAVSSGQTNTEPPPAPTPTPTPTPTPCPSPTPTPQQVNLPAACTNLTSDECKAELPKVIPECTDLNSNVCKTKAELLSACLKDSNSEECKRARVLLTIPDCVADLNSDVCKTKTELVSDCVKDPKSKECKQARVLITVPECLDDKDSRACKEGVLFASIPACTTCKPGKDPKDSPQCKLEFNQRQLEALNLPIGWSSVDDIQRKWPGSNVFDSGGWVDQLRWHFFGWILTALAISLGAPFWFDLLNKFIVIRSAVKPHEKSPEEESKD